MKSLPVVGMVTLLALRVWAGLAQFRWPEALLVTERSLGLDGLPGLDILARPETILSLGDEVYVARSIPVE